MVAIRKFILLSFAFLSTFAFAQGYIEQLNVDNVRIDGSTVSTTNVNGDLNLTPNGTGKVLIPGLTASTVPYLDASKKLSSSAVTPTELGYLSGVTSALQTQLSLLAPKASPTFTGSITADILNLGGGSFGQLVGIAQLGLNLSSDTTTTGAAADLTVSAPVTVLSNASLAGIRTLNTGSGTWAIIKNGKATGSITIFNNTGGLAPNRIITGTGADLTLATGTAIELAYDTLNSRWQVVGGTGSGGGAATTAFTDNTFTVGDDGDATKKLAFQASGITTGTTRTWTVPDFSDTLVGLTGTQTLTNKTITSPVIGTIVNTGTLTLPTSTDTLVGRATTDTLTNKTLTSPVISTITNTGTLTLPTSTDTLVGRATTDTLTNKTLSAPTFTGTITTPLTASRAVVTGASSQLAASTATATEVGFLSGVTSAIQTQLGLLAPKASPIFTGTIGLQGSGSGVISIVPQAAAGTYNFNLPTTAGIAGQVLTSAGGGASAMTWGTASAAGSGAKNYLGTINGTNNNGDFELGSTSGWSTFNTTITSLIPTGTINASSGSITTFTATSGQPMSGTYALQATWTTAASEAGEGIISSAFTIDTSDKSRVMSFHFNYKAPFGVGTYSGTSANTFHVYIYDVTNAVWIQPAGVYSMTQNAGIGLASGTFQTSSNSTQYRLAILMPISIGTNADTYFDDFFVGPQIAPIGAAATDWASFTPTGNWIANTTYTGQYRFVGDSVEIQESIATSGAPTSATLLLDLPSGLVIDTTKLAANSAGITIFSSDGSIDDSATTFYRASVTYQSTTTVRVKYASTATDTMANVTQAAPFTFGAGDSVFVKYTVPIVGHSSNVQMSADTDTRIVSFSSYRNTNQTAVAPNASAVKVAYDTVTTDTHAGFSTSGNRYVVPVSGYYVFSAVIAVATTNVLASPYYLQFFKNGVVIQNGAEQTPPVSQTVMLSGTTAPIFMTAGDYMEVDLFGSGNNSASQLTVNGGATNSWFSGYRLSGPSVVAATESVNMGYVDTSGAAIGTSAATYTFGTKVYDTHNAYSGGTYTVPVAGKYRVYASMFSGAVTLSTAQHFDIYVAQNGTNKSQNWAYGNGASNGYNVSGSVTLTCRAGDTIQIKMASSVATTANTGAALNNLNIERIGN